MRCTPCGKARYATQEAAVAALRRIECLNPTGRRRPVRAYQAECGWWHLTSQPAPRWARNTARA